MCWRYVGHVSIAPHTYIQLPFIPHHTFVCRWVESTACTITRSMLAEVRPCSRSNVNYYVCIVSVYVCMCVYIYSASVIASY